MLLLVIKVSFTLQLLNELVLLAFAFFDLRLINMIASTMCVLTHFIRTIDLSVGRLSWDLLILLLLLICWNFTTHLINYIVFKIIQNHTSKDH
jgi:hypothetical protein